MHSGLRSAALLAGTVVVVIVVFLIVESTPFMAQVGTTRLFTDATWSPTSNLYNVTPMLVGTALTTGGALVLAVPLGLLSAVFAHFYCHPRAVGWYRRLVEILAGIPSVVYGFWGLVVLVPKINAIAPPGASLLAGAIVLAIMILPTLALVADASFAAVPAETMRGAAALGLGVWGTLRLAVLPSASSGLITGTLLQTGRALGETMAVLLVCGNIVQVPGSVFDPIRTLTANIALEMAYATGHHRAALFACGLLLMIAVAALVVGAEGFSRGRSHG